MEDASAKIDQVVPGTKWEFDSEVAAVFDNMLERSIPHYNVMRKSVFDLACRYVQPRTDIVDLGCSRGTGLAPLVDKFGAYNRFVGVEISDPMLEACRERFTGYIRTGIVDIRKMDLRREYPPVQASVTLCILTLQFVPIEYRQTVVKRIYDHTLPGGAVIVVEKVLGSNDESDRAMVDAYYDLKRENGYTQEQIDRKRVSLEGVLVPLTCGWNEELIRNAGFRNIDCFWRWMNFAGWVALK